MKLNLSVYDNKDYFKNYLKLIKTSEDKLDSEMVDLESRLAIAVGDGRLEPDEASETLGDMGHEHYLIIQPMYRSFVLGVFVYMEARMKELCEHLERNNGESFSHKDLSGSGVARLNIYLEKVLKINFPENKDLKKDFEIARRIRNAIVHDESYLEEGKQLEKDVESFVKRNPKTLIVHNHELLINSQYAEWMLELNSKICEEISKNWTEDF